MTSVLQHHKPGQVVRFVVAVTLVGVLWFVSARVILGAPREVKEIILTTTADFAPGTFQRTGLVSQGDGAVQLMPVGIIGTWNADLQQLPSPHAQLAAVTAGNRIYAFGGIDPNNSYLPGRDVYATTVAGTSLSGWVTQTNGLPIGLAGHIGLVASAGGTTRIYAIGGYDETGAVSNKIFYAPILGDGSVGAWVTNTVDLPAGLKFASGVVNKGRIYVIGGIQGDGTYSTEVHQGAIQSDGSILSWPPVSTLPQPLALSAAVVYNGTNTDTIFLLGGALSAITNTASVLFADINPGTGALLGWNSSPGILPEAFSSHAAIQYNGQIYVIGGNSGGFSSNLQPRNTVLSALVDENNPTRRLLDFGGGTSWLTSNALPVPLRFLAAVVAGGEIFTVGGDKSTIPSQVDLNAVSYHGSTQGQALRYAPSGNYLTPVIDVGSPISMTQFFWSAQTNGQELTMRYRTSNDATNWSNWSPLFAASRQELNVTARFFQAQAFFTSTVSNTTPYLLDIHLVYGLPSSDLGVSKSEQPPAALPGGLITYTIVYSNAVGSGPTPNVVLTETLPANTTFVGPPGWTLVGGNTYVKSVGLVQVGTITSTQFVVRVDLNIPASVPSITNTVMIGGDPTEQNLSNNTYTRVTPIQACATGVDLSVSKDDVFTFPRAGQVLTYTILYSNCGDTTANNVVLTETVPAGLIPQDANWTSAGGNSYTRNVGSLGRGAGSVSFVARVDPNIAGGTFLTNTVSIGFPGVDVNPANNVATDVDYVTPANLRVFKYDEAAVVKPDQTTTYNIAVVNTGGAAASNVVITETPPLALVQVVSAPGWTPVGSAFVKSIGTLEPGASFNDTFTVRVLNSASNGSLITNTVRVNASNQDPSQTQFLTATDVNIVATGAPDLRIVAVNPEDAVAGQPTPFVVQITNAGTGPATTWFYTDMYVRRGTGSPPADRTELGDTYVDSGTGMAPGENRLLTFNWTFALTGTYQIYFQIDTCDTSSIGPSGLCLDPSYGRIPESNELNNIFGPVNVFVFKTTPQRTYLPFIAK